MDVVINDLTKFLVWFNTFYRECLSQSNSLVSNNLTFIEVGRDCFMYVLTKPAFAKLKELSLI